MRFANFINSLPISYHNGVFLHLVQPDTQLVIGTAIKSIVGLRIKSPTKFYNRKIHCMYFKSLNGKSLSAVMLCVVFALSSCKKDFPPIFKGSHSGNPVVLVAGYESNGTNNVAKYWIDGQEIELSDGTHNATANSIFVSDNDVYVAGMNSGAVYWKNNREIRLSGNNASSIFVSGNDVYVGGSDSTHAVYWKNGKKIILEKSNLSVNFNSFAVYSIFVSGNDVYAAGFDDQNAVYWKNGSEFFLTAYTPEFEGTAHANSIYVSGSDVFVVGYVNSSGSVFPQVLYWKNGVLVPLSVADHLGQANSVFVSGSDVYIAGMHEANPHYVATAAYWKNGNSILLPLTEMNSSANSIFVSGSHVYVAGYEFVAYQESYAVYWKDEVETKLTDGTHDAIATSIFIK
jgi:hypothetical protein